MAGDQGTWSTSPSPPQPVSEKDVPKQRRASPVSPVLVGGLVAAVVIVVALALGLGLGLGLHKHVRHSSAGANGTTATNGTNSSTTPSDSLASLEVPPWRLNTEEYNLDMTSWDIDAPPTTRSYNFTLSEIELAPDGMRVFTKVTNGTANICRRSPKDARHQ